MPGGTTIRAYAKINLTLEVLGVRPDGYHALRSVVMPVSLFDTVRLEMASDVTSDYPGEGDISVKAARAILPPGAGVRISLDKAIPEGGGLGGGSADAAAVLVALNEMYSLGLGVDRLAQIASSVGSDVPALVLARYAGAVVMEGRGEKVSPLGVSPGRTLHIVLANPRVHASTKEVFARCSSHMAQNPEILYNMREALASSDRGKISEALANDLSGAAAALHPEIASAAERLGAVVNSRVSMTGSGATVFALADSPETADAAVAALEAEGFWAKHVTNECPVV